MEKHLEHLITCAVCLDRFTMPKILPCQHTFCMRPCLHNLVVDKTIKCPSCRCTHKLPRTGLSGLPNNLTIIAILELPQTNQNKEKGCQECSKEDCQLRKCSHCDKRLCKDCSFSHSQLLLQALVRSINQVKKVLPKVSNMIGELAEKQAKSASMRNSVKADVNQAIDRCITELKNRQNILLDNVDMCMVAESRQIQEDQNTLEVEFATLSSHCEDAEKKCQSFSNLDNSEPSMTPDEISLLTRQSQEHLRSIRTITSNIEDTMQRTLKFDQEKERSLLTTAATFGAISYGIPTRLSLTLGVDPAVNGRTIDRAMHAQTVVHGRRASNDVINPYVPSFSTPLLDIPNVPEDSVSPAPSGESSSPYGSLDSTSSSRPINNPPRQGNPSRRRQTTRPSQPMGDSSERTGSYMALSSIRSSSLTRSENSAPLRQMRLRYRDKGQVKRWFCTKGSDIGNLNWPRGVAVTPNDDIVVADSSNHRVHIFNSSGEPTLTFGGYGTEEGHFDCLAGVHVTAQGWIIVADRYNHRVQIFDSMGRFIRMFGQEGSGEGDLSYPWGVATDNMGFVYVCDKDNHRIQVFTLDGQFIRKFGRIGVYDGHFDSPQYLAVTQDSKVIVSDSGNHRIQVFDKYGRFLYKFGREGSSHGQLKYPRGIALDSHGNVVVGDSGNNRMQVFSQDGGYITGFGSWGSAPGQMKGIEGVALLSNNDIVLSDRENHRMQIF